MLGYFDAFGTDLRASVVSLAAEIAMRFCHYFQAFYLVSYAAVEDVAVGSDDGGGSHVSRIFFLTDRAGTNAARTHDAFYVVVK